MKNDLRDIYNKYLIMVIATVSSGKSTLINSLLGGDVLPARNEACTAKAFFISNSERKEENKVILYKKNGSCEEVCVDDFESLNSFNENKDTEKIFFEHGFEGIYDNNILLVDTPGVNNSQSDEHGSVTYDLIGKARKGILLYVINATQIGIDDDRKLMSRVIEILNENKGNLDIIFAVNKVDEFDLEKENLDSILENVKRYIFSCVKSGEAFLSEREVEKRLFPISALTAKVIRKRLNGDSLTRLEKRILKNLDVYDELNQYQLERYALTNDSVASVINKRLSELEYDNEENFYRRILIHTGIPVIEETVNDYFKNKGDSGQSLEF